LWLLSLTIAACWADGAAVSGGQSESDFAGYSETLFAVLTALNSCGYNVDLNIPTRSG